MQITQLIALPAVIAAFIAFVATPVLIKLAPKLGILDDPVKRRHPAVLHTKPVPRGGGVPLFLAILITSLIFLPLEQRLLGILLGAAVVVIIGFLDDRKDINPYIRLVAQFLAAGVVVLSGIGIAFISNPLGGIIDMSQTRFVFDAFGQERDIWILSAIFGFLWIVGIMNAVSWSSGVDGQLSGFAVIAALVIAILSLQFSADITQWPVTILAAATFGAFLGFLPWHVYPQKIMPGFGGATLAGFMLAVLSLLTTTKIGTLLVVLAIPIADAAYSIIRRMLAGKSPVWGDRKHLHHRLLDLGWTKPKVAYFYWTGTAILGFLALNLQAVGKFYTIIGVALVVGGILAWLAWHLQFSKRRAPDNG